MGQVILSLVSGLLGAVVGGALTVWGSLKTLDRTIANLERAEIRRMRVECVVNLGGLRGLLGEGKHVMAEADIAKLMFELNRIQLLWADNSDVLRAVRDYHEQPTNKDRLFALIRTAGADTRLGTHN